MLELAGEAAGVQRSVFVSFSEGGCCRSFLEKVRRAGFEGVELTHDTPHLVAATHELTRLLRGRSAAILCVTGYKANLLGLLAARRVGIPVVSVSRGWTGENLRVRLYEAFDRIVLGRMDRVVCVSQGQADRVRRAGVPLAKTCVIHNAVRPERFAQPQQEYRRRLQSMFPDPPAMIVGAAGRLSPEKGFDVLVDAAARVLNARKARSRVARAGGSVGFVVFGEGSMRDALAARIEQLGLDCSFVLGGFRTNLDQYLPHFDLLVLPSYTEGLPNVALEALAAGVPVVATRVGGTPEVVEDGLSGCLVPPGDPAAMAQRISELLSNPAMRQAMGAQGRERVVRDFSFASQVLAYRRVFDRLASAAPKARSAKRRPHRPVRVCFVIDRLSRAGTESQLLALIEKINRSKVRPHLCLLDGRDEPSARLQPEDCPTLRLGVRSLHRRSTLRRAWEFARFLRRERIDIVQTHFADSTRFAVPIARLVGVPHVVATRRNLGHWMKPIDRWVGRLVNCLVDVTLANCRACRTAVIEQEGARAPSVLVMENGVRMGAFAHIAPVSPRRNGHPPRVGMVANLRPVKGPDVFIRAAARLSALHPDVTFHLAGVGDRQWLSEIVEESAVADRFEFVGQVEDVPAFLADLDVAVLTSHCEGLSNAILEYMAAGRPIVATAVGGNLELIDHGVTGLLAPPADPKAVARAIDRLLQDRVLAARLGAAARRRVRQHNRLEPMARRYEAFCQDLVGTGRQHASTLGTAIP